MIVSGLKIQNMIDINKIDIDKILKDTFKDCEQLNLQQYKEF